ncbi:hypothetical protein F5888DRAFT_1234137 [Russula emetica]|nr:hypothetical protein F5888DRAFT_1234137 [Russula emetica]
MASISSFPSLVSHKTPFIIVLAGSIVSLGPQWRNCISSYIDPLAKRLSEENYSRSLARMQLAYSQAHSALIIDPAYPVVGHDEEENIMIVEDSPDIAAFWSYMSVIKIIDDVQTSHPNEFSFFLWHVVAGQYGSWDPKWDIVCGELMKRDVNLSMVLLDDCPIFVQLFNAISPASSHITPWFPTFSPYHRFLLSGFVPPGELGETAWDSPFESPTHGTQNPDDQWAGPPLPLYAGSDVHAQVPAIAPFPYPYEGPQASSSAAVQNQPHLNPNNMSVPESQGPAPMD